MIVSCHDQNKSAIQPEQKTFPASVIDSVIRELEDIEWARAIAKKDTQWLQLHLADELIMTTGRTGELANKQQVINEITDTAYGSGGNDKLEDLEIRSFENTAVATFKILTHGKDKDGPYYRVARYTDVWIFRNERWQLLASHSSLMP
ncbi:MAG: nuclear transport factor 2 family protein [Bacteroidota bacterium]